jgi:DNA-binding CsgD family transcriptional regulator
MIRVPTVTPLSPMQRMVADLLGIGLTADSVAANLKITRAGVRYHVQSAAKKIPGDLPAQMRVIAWARGASVDVLQGATLKVEVMNAAAERRGSHSASIVQLTSMP